MKKTFFLVIILLSFQGFSQVQSGVYSVGETVSYEWDEGLPIGDGYEYSQKFLIHITNNGFRIYQKPNDTGTSFSLIYIGTTKDNYYVYAVPPGDRFEIGDNLAVHFYNFDNETGWYQSSTEWRDLEYISNVPILDYEEEEE